MKQGKEERQDGEACRDSGERRDGESGQNKTGHSDGKRRKDGKRRGAHGAKPIKRAVAGSFLALIVVIGALLGSYLWRLRSAAAVSVVRVRFGQETISITWEPSFQMDACRLFRYDEGTGEFVFYKEYPGGTFTMDAGEVADGTKLRLQAVRYEELFGQRIELPGFSKEWTFHSMADMKLYSYVIPDEKIAFINWQENADSSYEVYCLEEGRPQLYSETASNTIMLNFTNEFSVPDRGDALRIAVRTVQKEDGCLFYGPLSECVEFSRNDLLENDLSLCWEQVEERQYVLSWQEGHGSRYEVQQWLEEEKRWVSRCVRDWTDEMSYRTDHLPSGAQVRFRVITYDNEEDREREEYPAEPSEVTFHTGISTIYCTIWPIRKLTITEEPKGGEILGEVPAGVALCVLEESGGCFQILYKDCLGYIDADFCMINLPEYLGDLCEYDITNSISSIFRVHEYDIPEITGSMVKGYENVCLGNGDYLVPYLYPCTAKLYQAAVNAAADGYGLRIYDAFRPNEATRYLYDTVEALLDEPVIGENGGNGGAAQESVERETVDGEPAEEGWGADEDRTADGEHPADESREATGEHTAEEGREAEGEHAAEEGREADGNQEAAGEYPADEAFPEEAYDTYRIIMTDNGRYRLRSFLAPTISTHNRGIALDLELIDAGTKEGLLMQTEIHDLSWYSVTGQNNENALLLAQYMKGAGYNDLVTEWWHFQDDDTRDRIGLDSYLTEGVSVEGWKRDDTGWRYRLSDGSYYQNATAVIDGQEYFFDAEGYCPREDLEE